MMDCCSFLDCSLPPTCVCKCTEPETKLCDEHTNEHLDLDGSHSILTNYIALMPGKYALSKQCSACHKMFSVTNEKMIRILNENIKKITKLTMKFIKKNRQMEILYLEAAYFLKINDKIIKKTSYTAVEEFILNNLENPYEILAYFNKAETNLIKEIDLKQISQDHNDDELLRLRKEFKNKIIEFNALKESFKKVVEKNEKEINEVRQEYERTIMEMGIEIENKTRISNKEISEINERLREAKNLIEIKDEQISSINSKIKGPLNSVEQIDKEVKIATDYKNKEFSKFNNQIREVNQEYEMIIEKLAKEIENNKTKAAKEISEINERLQKSLKLKQSELRAKVKSTTIHISVYMLIDVWECSCG